MFVQELPIDVPNRDRKKVGIDRFWAQKMDLQKLWVFF